MTRGAWVATAIAAACGHGSGTSPDAAPTADHVVFLQFEGQAIVASTTTDDATTNTSTIARTDGTVSPMFLGDATRAHRIADIVAEMTSVLAPYDIGLVTTRPSSPPYDMIVIGGTMAQIGIPPPPGGTVFTISLVNCGYTTPNVIAFLFDSGLTEPIAQHTYAKSVISVLALSHGVPGALRANDCLCLPGNNSGCGIGDGTYASACTFDPAGIAIDPNTACGATGTTYDPSAAMLAAFGAHR